MPGTAAPHQKMKHYISLGFSCQSRFAIDSLSADHRAMPYDWLISTKAFILETLTSLDGREFTPSTGALQIHEAKSEGMQGAYGNGAWFWHDFPRNGNRLAENWRAETNHLAKYPKLWKRFLDLIRDGSRRKVFVLSNSQFNLPEFLRPPGDFSAHYGINAAYLELLNQKLEAAGAVNFEFLVLLRSLGEFIDIGQNCRLQNLDARFVGTLSLPIHIQVASSLLHPAKAGPDLDRLIGRYDNGVEIIRAPFDSLLVLAPGNVSWGVARRHFNGYLFSMVGPINSLHKAIEDDGSLYFSTKDRWRKISE